MSDAGTVSFWLLDQEDTSLEFVKVWSVGLWLSCLHFLLVLMTKDRQDAVSAHVCAWTCVCTCVCMCVCVYSLNACWTELVTAVGSSALQLAVSSETPWTRPADSVFPSLQIRLGGIGPQ